MISVVIVFVRAGGQVFVNALRVACLCGAKVSPGAAFLYATGCLVSRWLSKLLVPPPYARLTPLHDLQIAAFNFFSLIATSVSSKNSHTGLVRFLVDILLISLTNCACAVSRGRIRCHFGIRILNFYADIRTNRIFVAALI